MVRKDADESHWGVGEDSVQDKLVKTYIMEEEEFEDNLYELIKDPNTHIQLVVCSATAWKWVLMYKFVDIRVDQNYCGLNTSCYKREKFTEDGIIRRST